MTLKDKIITTLEACYLCIRFPFLYPRNRFTGKHTVHILGEFLHKLYNESIHEISITGRLEKNRDTLFDDGVEKHNCYVSLWKQQRELIISNGVDFKIYDLTKLLVKKDEFEILGLSSYNIGDDKFGIIVHVKTVDESDETNYGFRYERVELVKNNFKYTLYKIFKWIDSEILDRVLFIPTYTELDAMPEGWRKAFGIQMCKEIKAQLKKEHNLYKYRITQIKEKFGVLCWYDDHSSREVQDIISKYEDLSWNTCIECGEPATKISAGWICPYCDKHFPAAYGVLQEKIDGKWVSKDV